MLENIKKCNIFFIFYADFKQQATHATKDKDRYKWL